MPIEPHPALNPERVEFRSRYNLRPLSSGESGLPAALLPEGVYGFSTSAATNEIAVFDQPVFRCFEIHKLAGGQIQFVGYMNDADRHALFEAIEPALVNLYPDPTEAASNLVEVPASRIGRKRPPLRDSGSPMQLEIAPKP